MTTDKEGLPPDLTQTIQESEKLADMAENAQKRADEVKELMSDFHKHKLATEAHKLALRSEVELLRKQHKELRKNAGTYLKEQKKQKKEGYVGLSGFAKQLTNKLFKHNTDGEANLTTTDSPPSYEGPGPSAPTAEVEINVAETEVNDAYENAKHKMTKAELAERYFKEIERFLEEAKQNKRKDEINRLTKELSVALAKVKKTRLQALKAEGIATKLTQKFQKERALSDTNGGFPQIRTSEISMGSPEVNPDHKKGLDVPFVQPGPSYQSLYPSLTKQQVKWTSTPMVKFEKEDIPKPIKIKGYSLLEYRHQGIETSDSASSDESENGPGQSAFMHENKISKGNAILSQSKYKADTSTSAPLQQISNVSITDLKKLVMPLMPGQEVDWAIITRDPVINRLQPGNERLKFHQLSSHPEALAQAMALLIQAARSKDADFNPLQKFFDWLCIKYKSTPRQRRVQFAQLLKNILWTWKDNPADQIRDAMNKVHLTWEEVVQDTALREELKAGVANKLDDGLFLTLSETPIADWHAKLTSFWNKLRDSKPIDNSEPVELYNADEDSEDEDSPEIMIAKVDESPKIKSPKPDFAEVHEQLKEIMSALQATVTPVNKQSKGNADTRTVPSDNSTRRQSNQETRKCFRCGKIGHLIRDCRVKMPQNQQYQRKGPGNRFNHGFQNNQGWKSNFQNNQGKFNANGNYGQQQQLQNKSYQRLIPNQNQLQQRRQMGHPRAAWTEPQLMGEDDKPALTPAAHAEANFMEGLTPNRRWNAETTRPPMMYEEAMGNLAHTAEAPDIVDLPRIDFLGPR